MKQAHFYVCAITVAAIGLSIAFGPTTASAQERIIRVEYDLTITDPDSKNVLYTKRQSAVSWGSFSGCSTVPWRWLPP